MHGLHIKPYRKWKNSEDKWLNIRWCRHFCRCLSVQQRDTPSDAWPADASVACIARCRRSAQLSHCTLHHVVLAARASGTRTTLSTFRHRLLPPHNHRQVHLVGPESCRDALAAPSDSQGSDWLESLRSFHPGNGSQTNNFTSDQLDYN